MATVFSRNMSLYVVNKLMLEHRWCCVDQVAIENVEINKYNVLMLPKSKLRYIQQLKKY